MAGYQRVGVYMQWRMQGGGHRGQLPPPRPWEQNVGILKLRDLYNYWQSRIQRGRGRSTPPLSFPHTPKSCRVENKLSNYTKYVMIR